MGNQFCADVKNNHRLDRLDDDDELTEYMTTFNQYAHTFKQDFLSYKDINFKELQPLKIMQKLH